MLNQNLPMNLAINLAEHRILNDTLIRIGIGKLLRERLTELEASPCTAEQWVNELSRRHIAEETDAANEQHYEVPAPYFQLVLGSHLKYSSGYWSKGCDSLETAEAAMLQLSCQRAQLSNGQRILELGCGWGSLSLWMAAHYPESEIVSVSNSHSQKAYIDAQAKHRGLSNLTVVTADINRFQPEGQFDRIVSVEMFEHVRNHRHLFLRLSEWLEPEGKIFLHVFANRKHCYLFEPRSSKDWMSKYFFTGGIMPSADLLPCAAADILEEEERWEVNGQHYSKTLEAWLMLQDANEAEVLKLFRECYGKQAKVWLQRWRIFYMACSELFAYRGGNEWCVMHYRFGKPKQ